jgi:hypothetical protein
MIRNLLSCMFLVLFLFSATATAQQQEGHLAFDPYAQEAFAGITIPLEVGANPIYMGLSMNEDGRLIIHNVGEGMAECYRIDKRSTPRLPSSYLHIAPHRSSPPLFVPAHSQGDWLCFSAEGTVVTRDQQRGFERRSPSE